MPVARYVDDFFGISKDEVSWTGGVCLSLLSKLCGFPCDEDKSADGMLAMVVLGI